MLAQALRRAVQSELLAHEVLAALADHDVDGEVVRVVDHLVRFGVSTDEGDGDAWPAIRSRLLTYGQVAAVAVVDNEDGAHQVRADVFQARPASSTCPSAHICRRARPLDEAVPPHAWVLVAELLDAAADMRARAPQGADPWARAALWPRPPATAARCAA